MTFGYGHQSGSSRACGVAVRAAAIVVPTLLAIATNAMAQSVTLQSYRDATIRAGSYASTNYGDDSILETRVSADPDYLRRAVLMFDTAAVLPSTAQIGSAQLVITVKGGNAATRRLGTCAVPVSFREAEVTWTRRNSSTYWSNPGGDVVGSDCSEATVTAVANSRVVFDVTGRCRRR